MSQNPLSIRETLLLILPKSVVDFFGPYADEVGLLPVVAKWFAIIYGFIWATGVLIPSASDIAYAKSQIATGLVFIPVGLAILLWNRRR